RNLRSIQQCSRLPHEIIVIVDGCTDGTKEVVEKWAKEECRAEGKTRGITVAIVTDGVFETISDSIGCALASGEFLLEVQADMFIWERGFDNILVRTLELLPELIAVGGRGAHSFRLVSGHASRSSRDIVARASRELFWSAARIFRQYNPTQAELHLSDSIGRVGDLIECRVKFTERPRPIFVHETIMRGPLAVRRSDFLSLGGFDTSNFFLGNDDHDFAMRALVQLGRRVGYVPIGFDSPVAVGTTRAPRDPQAEARFRELNQYYATRFTRSSLAIHGRNFVAPRRYVAHIPLEWS
ncbi:MAG TPA: hypothetical protein VGE93_24330, partial [Bryobacteraceae bacterium]